MTAPQEEALDAVRRILVANFDSYVLTVRNTDDNQKTGVSTRWHGPWPDVVGLNHITEVRLAALETQDLRDGSETSPKE